MQEWLICTHEKPPGVSALRLVALFPEKSIMTSEVGMQALAQ